MLCACGFKYTPLWIQGLKRLVLWTQNLTLLEDQGLWTQTPVLNLSYAKAASPCFCRKSEIESSILLLRERERTSIEREKQGEGEKFYREREIGLREREKEKSCTKK